MLYEVCLVTFDGSVQRIAVEGKNKTDAKNTALRFASRDTYEPISYIRKINEHEYLSLNDDLYYGEDFYNSAA